MKIFLFLGLSYLLISCHDNRVFEYNVDMDDRVWIVEDCMKFDFSIQDYRKGYNFYYLIRNSLEFPFSRIFIEYTLHNEKGDVLEKKLEFNYLFNQKTGVPHGNNGLGSVFSHQFLFLENYHFKQPGIYTVQLEQFNRKDTLQGVLSVGMRVEYVE